jgi:Protein of unknown function (DUF3072)
MDEAKAAGAMEIAAAAAPARSAGEIFFRLTSMSADVPRMRYFETSMLGGKASGSRRRPGFAIRSRFLRFEHACDGNSARMNDDAQLQNPEKDTSDWVTGDEPMTGPQRSYLQTLAQEAKEEVPDDLTKAQASEAIDRLQQETGRGR